MDLLTELRNIIPDASRVTDEESVRAKRSQGFTYYTPRLPDVVVFPKDKTEVSAVLRFANERHIPVVPVGLVTSLEGHIIPVRGGISLDLMLMNQIVEIRPPDFLARVQPGVTRTQLNAQLKPHGLFFSVDPGMDASFGGMAATNAGGTNAVRYGVMRHQVLGLEVALADGTFLRTGSTTFKTSAGYDLTDLFVGSEGTLGVFTELTVRLYPIPACVVAARAVFPDIEAAGRAAVRMIRAGMAVGRAELVDERTISAVNAYRGTQYPEAPTLFLEFSGNEPGVQRDIEQAQEIANQERCQAWAFERDEAARERLWDARHAAALAIIATAPTKGPMTTDVCVPIAELPGALRHARQTVAAHDLEGAILGHVGDGNYHTVFMVDPHDPAEVERAERVNAEIVRYGLSRGGTCTGEHGVGFGKIGYLAAEHGDALPLMRTIKQAMDPNDILNPGKLFA